MIFSVITGTPCLVLDSKTSKVSGFYDAWLASYRACVLVREVDAGRIRELVAGLLADHSERSVEIPSATFIEQFDAMSLISDR